MVTPITKKILSYYCFMFTSSFKKDPLESIDSGDKVTKVFNEIFEFG